VTAVAGGPAPSSRAVQPAHDLAELLTSEPAGRRDALTARVAAFLQAVNIDAGAGVAEMLEALERALATLGPQESWLALAVITADMPLPAGVRRLHRAALLGEGLTTLFDMLADDTRFGLDRTPGHRGEMAWPEVEILTGAVVVDLHHTARNLFATGIQRVSREAARRWCRDHDVTTIGWTRGYRALRRLTPEQRAIALEGRATSDEAGDTSPRPPLRPADNDEVIPPGGDPTPVLVCWRCTHIVPELPAEPERAGRYHGFAEFSRSQTGIVGHDTVPVTAAETTSEGMAYGFTGFLAAAARADRICTDSEASANEYRGWRAMLAGTGLEGPQIRAILLGSESSPTTEADVAEASDLLGVGSLPIVLTVGSHEPRKNHLAVLHAAELLWREGIDFTLTFIGGNSWNSSLFEQRVAELQQANRPIQILTGTADRLLWAAYRVARCTVFPSLHEGFGLPVVESLACGTPVITSDFGAVAESARHGGALLVDPRDDHSIAAAMRAILTDDELHARLAAEAAALPQRSWDDYARQAWAFLVDGDEPDN